MSGRIRTVKPEWLEDELLAGASDSARVLSVALLLMADDYGNGRASLASIATGAWRFEMERDDGERAPEVLARARDALSELIKIGFISTYGVAKQRYFSIRNWTKHQRVVHPGKPRVPGPEMADSLENVDLARVSRESHEEIGESRESLAPDLRSHTSDLRSPTATPARAHEAEPSVRSTDTPHWLRQATGPDPLTTRCLRAFDEGYASAAPNGKALGVSNHYADDGVREHVAIATEMSPAEPAELFREAGRELAHRVIRGAKDGYPIRSAWSTFLKSPLGTFLGARDSTAPDSTPNRLDLARASKKSTGEALRRANDALDRALPVDLARLEAEAETARTADVAAARALRELEADQTRRSA